MCGGGNSGKDFLRFADPVLGNLIAEKGTPFDKKEKPKDKPKTPGLNAGDPEVQAAMQRQRELERQRRGRLSTVLTSTQGDLSTANTSRKTLLGQ